MIQALVIAQTVLVSLSATFTAGFGTIAIEDMLSLYQPLHSGNLYLAYGFACLTLFGCIPWLISLGILYLERRIK